MNKEWTFPSKKQIFQFQTLETSCYFSNDCSSKFIANILLYFKQFHWDPGALSLFHFHYTGIIQTKTKINRNNHNLAFKAIIISILLRLRLDYTGILFMKWKWNEMKWITKIKRHMNNFYEVIMNKYGFLNRCWKI